MLEVNARHGLQHKWLDIQYVDADKSWYAWYMSMVEIDQIKGEISS